MFVCVTDSIGAGVDTAGGGTANSIGAGIAMGAAGSDGALVRLSPASSALKPANDASAVLRKAM
jgi:hypothetical protein